MAKKTGRNDPCPCGSGKKYKNCCLGKEQKTRGVKWEDNPVFINSKEVRRYFLNAIPRALESALLEAIPERGRVLELGSGDAWLFRRGMPASVKNRIEEYTLYDISERAHQRARALLNSDPFPGKIKFVRGDMRDLRGIEDRSVDAVLSLNALDLLNPEDLKRVGGEVLRVLKPGGRFLHLMDVYPYGQEYAEDLERIKRVGEPITARDREIASRVYERVGQQIGSAHKGAEMVKGVTLYGYWIGEREPRHNKAYGPVKNDKGSVQVVRNARSVVLRDSQVGCSPSPNIHRNIDIKTLTRIKDPFSEEVYIRAVKGKKPFNSSKTKNKTK